MGRTLFVLAIVSFLLLGTLLTGFPSPAQKEHAAQYKIQKAQIGLNIAREDANQVAQKTANEEILKRKILESEITINDNENRIADLNLKKINADPDNDELYDDRIRSFEMKNVALKKRIADNEKSLSYWEKIKRELTHGANELGDDFESFVVENWK